MGQRERATAFLSKALTMLDVCVIFGHHSEATETTSKLVNSSVKFSVTIKCGIYLLEPVITSDNLA